MKNLLILFICCYSFLANGQNRVTYYGQLDDLLNNDQLEEIISLEPQVLINTSVTDTLSADILSIYGETYRALNDFEKALSYYQKAVIISEQLIPLETRGYSNQLYQLTLAYLDLGKFPESKSAVKKLLNVDARLFGKKSQSYLESVLFYIDILIENSEYNEALDVVNSQIKIIENNQIGEAIFKAKQGDILSLLGNYDESKRALLEASNTFSDLSDTLNYEVTQGLLGLNYINQGKYPAAENIYLQAIDNLSKIENALFFIDDMKSNLALSQMALGRSKEAILIYNNLLKKDSTVFGIIHPNYLNSLLNLGMAYYDMGDYTKGENELKRALEICLLIYAKDSEVEATILNNLANNYRDQGKLDLAIQTFQKSKSIYEKVEGKKSANYATVVYNIGRTLLLKKASDTEKVLLEALKLREDALGNSHPKYAEVTNYLAIYYWQKGDLKKSRKYFEETFNNFFEQIRMFFPSLSEEEKTKFYLEKLKPTFEQFNSLAAQMMSSDPSVLGDLYNYQLRTKGIIMVATERLRQDIYNSKDSSLIADYDLWKVTKERLSKLYSNNDPRQNVIDSLNDYANKLEKNLVSRSAHFAETYKDELPDWKKVQATLKEGESAVEIIRYRVADADKGGIFTESIHYLALVIDKNSEYPSSVLLTRGSLMEGRYLNNYRNSIRYQIPDNFTYEELWKPLQNKFQGKKKVYISPDGVYNQVNMSTLVNPETKEYLIKEIEIQEVTSTRDLLTKSKSVKTSSTKFLIGFPTYTTVTKDNAEEVKVTRSLRGGDFSETRGLRGGLLRYMSSGEGIAELPGTKTEVEEISKIYTDLGEKSQVYTSNKANESTVKNIDNPGILHIATHGYFLESEPEPDFGKSNSYYQNPLLRAGIILAGAEDFLLTGTNAIDNEDGILTAYEAMNMDLQDTELVVLSACETGLGEVSNGEGVYGLQRAFKIAGARYLVMSMWNVDDDATQRLMTLFYENMATGNDKYYAFREAQIKLMDEFPEPFYWGAFKIVGD